jgi:HEAT repeat protein
MNKVFYSILIVFLLQSGAWAESSYSVRPMNEKKFFETIDLLRFGTFQEKLDAIGVLEQNKSRGAIPPLSLALSGEHVQPNPDTEYSHALVSIPSLDDVPEIKFYSARALGQLGHEEGIAPLIKEYKKREATIQETDKPLYSEHLNNPMTKQINMPLVMAVGEMLNALGDLPPTKESIETLKEALNHKNYYVRASAAEGLRRLGRMNTIEALEGALANEKVDYTKAAILSSLVGISKTENKHFVELVKLLGNANPNVQSRAAYGLAVSKVRTAETALRQQLEIEDHDMVRKDLKESITIVTSFLYPEYTMPQLVK